VRFQTALAAPKSASRDAWLAKMAREGVNGKWMSAAVLGDAGSGLFEQLRGDLSKLEPSFAESLITLAAAEGKDAATLITVVTTEPFKASWVKALGDGLRRAGSNLNKADNDGKLAAILTKASETAANAQASSSSRLDAIELLGVSASKEAQAALIACLGEKQPEAVQTAAIRVLAPNGSEAVTTALIGNWAHFGPKAQSVALEALLARDDRAVALLEAKVVKPEAFSAAQVQALIKHKSPQVAAAAKTALASVIPPSREEMAAKFKPAVAAKGDAKKGQVHYLARCLACHKAGANGIAVGPDLITVKTKGREALLEAILMPHKEVASQFIAYTVNTKDGQTLAGIITNDTASSMTIKMMGGLEKTLQRSEIKGSSSTGQSLMPEGLETGMTVEDMADLLSFIEGL